MKCSFLTTLLFFFPSFVYADATYTIQHLENAQNKALIAATDAVNHVKVGDEYFAETPIGNCYMQVQSVAQDFFHVSTAQCGQEFLSQGQAVFPKQNIVVEHQQVNQIAAPVADERITLSIRDRIDEQFYNDYLLNRLSFFLSYQAGHTLDGKANLDQQTSIGDFRTSNTLGLGADYRIMQFISNFSWSAGFNYNLPRSLGSYSVTTVNGTQSADFSNTPRLSLLSFYTNARYEFHPNFFAQLGLNYLIPNASGLAGTVSGDFGVHGGVRYYPYENLFIDGQLNLYNLNYTLLGRTYDFSLTEVELKGGYTF